MLRGFAALMAAMVLAFILDNLAIFWMDWPGIKQFLFHLGVLSPDKSFKGLDDAAVLRGWIELLLLITASACVVAWVKRSKARTMEQDALCYSGVAAFIVRAAFWSVLLVGAADMFISFLRVEGFLNHVVGDHLTTQLGRSIFRGTWVHYPLIVLAIVIAACTRGLGFVWLALMIVGAEFLIVITRFVFSYEQAFMGDLVRFWYAALFLFASAYTLLHDGHVRVDVLYANFSENR